MALLLRIWAWIGKWLQSRQAQNKADEAATTHLQDQTHAVTQSQADAPTDRAEFERRVRDGSSL